MRTGWLSSHAASALLALGLALLTPPLRAQDVQPVPPLSARVVDTTGVLEAPQRQALEDKLAALEKDKGSQVAILLVPTTAPEDIASYANRVGNSWKIGRREVGDGVLLVVALRDRTVRIEVAKALEGAIPDLAAKQIIERAITPRFRAGDIAGGLDAGVEQLAARIRGEPLPPVAEPQAQRGSGGVGLSNLAVMLFIGVPVAGALARGLFGRKLGALLTGGGAGLITWWLTSSLLIGGAAGLIALVFVLAAGTGLLPRGPGWGGHGGGWGGGLGGGGGGFGSGGGGDFGGGGASGRW